jgi:hypothetical protein
MFFTPTISFDTAQNMVQQWVFMNTVRGRKYDDHMIDCWFLARRHVPPKRRLTAFITSDPTQFSVTQPAFLCFREAGVPFQHACASSDAHLQITSLIRLQLIRMSDNPDRNMKNPVHSSVMGGKKVKLSPCLAN